MPGVGGDAAAPPATGVAVKLKMDFGVSYDDPSRILTAESIRDVVVSRVSGFPTNRHRPLMTDIAFSRLSIRYRIGIQVLYSGVLWPHPARATRLHHRWGYTGASSTCIV